MVALDTWISRYRFEAQVQEVLVEIAVPGQRCLLETVEGMNEAADIVCVGVSHTTIKSTKTFHKMDLAQGEC